MQPLRITRKLVDSATVQAAVMEVVREIRKAGAVEAIYLFGSAACGTVTDQSDLDFLIVCLDHQTIRDTQKKLRHIQTLTSFALDLVWVDLQRFKRLKDVGGVCFVAYHDGQRLFPDTES